MMAEVYHVDFGNFAQTPYGEVRGFEVTAYLFDRYQPLCPWDKRTGTEVLKELVGSVVQCLNEEGLHDFQVSTYCVSISCMHIVYDDGDEEVELTAEFNGNGIEVEDMRRIDRGGVKGMVDGNALLDELMGMGGLDDKDIERGMVVVE
jgi:hypothetical protein